MLSLCYMKKKKKHFKLIYSLGFSVELSLQKCNFSPFSLKLRPTAVKAAVKGSLFISPYLHCGSLL